MKVFWNEMSGLLREAWRLLKQHKWTALIGMLWVLVLAFVLFPYDAVLLNQIRVDETTPELARQLSYWGDFPTGILMLTVGLWLTGKFWKNAHWRQTALAILLSAAIAGIATNGFRMSLGRPRPSAGVEDRFYGFRKEYQFHGFPSGHSATAFGAAGAISAAMPPLAVPAMATAIGIGWSRLRLNRHYPTDILVGGAIGLLFGIPFGAAARRNFPS